MGVALGLARRFAAIVGETLAGSISRAQASVAADAHARAPARWSCSAPRLSRCGSYAPSLENRA
jgi:hypothetical protein